mgnify:CR=1 FL=1
MKEYDDVFVLKFEEGSKNYVIQYLEESYTMFYSYMVGYEKAKKEYFIKRKDYNNFLLTLTLSGEGTVSYEKREYNMKTNDLLFIDCNKPHTFKNNGDDPWTFYYIHTNGPSLKALYQHFCSYVDGNVYHNYDGKDFVEKINSILDMLSKNNCKVVGTNLYVNVITDDQKEFISSIIYSLSRSIERHIEKLKPTYPNSIKIVIEYIKNNFDKNITIDELSKLVNMSKYYFIRLFYKYIGTTPINYLNEIRFDMAQTYLESTDYSVKKIAYEVGFNSFQPLNNLFKMKLGLTPSQYRLNFKNKQNNK